VAVKIKLKRLGKIRTPKYRIVVADSRTKRDGRAIEEIGVYHPTEEPSLIRIDSDRAQHWLSVGAQPTEAVVALLKVTGDWQKFKGLPGAEGTLRVAEPKPARQVVFAAAVADAANEPARPKALKVEQPVVAAVVAAADEVAAEAAVDVDTAAVAAAEEIAEEAIAAPDAPAPADESAGETSE
jgi:small subunit ribosomal protein S16